MFIFRMWHLIAVFYFQVTDGMISGVLRSLALFLNPLFFPGMSIPDNLAPAASQNYGLGLLPGKGHVYQGKGLWD